MVGAIVVGVDEGWRDGQKDGTKEGQKDGLMNTGTLEGMDVGELGT
jgi:hypothetical protein